MKESRTDRPCGQAGDLVAQSLMVHPEDDQHAAQGEQVRQAEHDPVDVELVDGACDPGRDESCPV
jgi:hypothetical protein